MVHLLPSTTFDTQHFFPDLSYSPVLGHREPAITIESPGNMLNGNGISHSCSEQLEVFRKNNATHEAFVEDLVCNYEELQRKYAEKCDDYSNEVESRRMWQGKASMNERALVEQRQASVSSYRLLHVYLARR